MYLYVGMVCYYDVMNNSLVFEDFFKQIFILYMMRYCYFQVGVFFYSFIDSFFSFGIFGLVFMVDLYMEYNIKSCIIYLVMFCII